ncbi:MAG TPA: hypothetical protein VGO11_24295 [Chthoniobacteraceae bacterium]|jgi:hypothetical protein|nr:hypothetical protein [Chthoniobacteraceae bacterium]
MPLKWEPGRNPYQQTYFARLGFGPNVTTRQIPGLAKSRKQKLDHDRAKGETVELHGEPLDEHSLAEAQQKLIDPESRAHELLLVHPEPPREASNLDKACKALGEAAALPDERPPLPLTHPLAIFWFTPAPEMAAVSLPPLQAFGFIEAGAPDDLALDLVFDS